MTKYFTRKNLGWLMVIGFGAFLSMSIFGKLFGGDAAIEEMHIGHISGWLKIIGIGELLSLVLFIIPRTMKLGTVLLSAYFGGAIMFHMSHPDPAFTTFTGPSVFLIIVWITSWIRGNELIDFSSDKNS